MELKIYPDFIELEAENFADLIIGDYKFLEFYNPKQQGSLKKVSGKSEYVLVLGSPIVSYEKLGKKLQIYKRNQIVAAFENCTVIRTDLE